MYISFVIKQNAFMWSFISDFVGQPILGMDSSRNQNLEILDKPHKIIKNQQNILF